MKFSCPICGAELHHKRTDDGYRINRIHRDGTVELIGENSNGCDEVYCSENEEHKITQKLVNKILDLVL